MKISAPGKLILMGEHAVVYGRPALVAAVDLRLTVSLEARPGGMARIHLPALDFSQAVPWSEILALTRRARQGWESYAADPRPETFAGIAGGDPARVIKLALGETADHLGAEPPTGLELTVVSELPIGCGFGSSAAIALAVIEGYLTLTGRSPGPKEVESLALEVERRQHGFPSGVDGATILYGGLLWAERGERQGLDLTTLDCPSPYLADLRIYDTGRPEQGTGEVVAAVRGLYDSDPRRFDILLDQMAQGTRELRDLLVDTAGHPPPPRGPGFAGLLSAYQTGLEELGVVPPSVRALIRRIEARGGAAKISGAGALTAEAPGSGAGSLIVYHPEPQSISGWDFLAGLRHHPVILGGPGLRREESP